MTNTDIKSESTQSSKSKRTISSNGGVEKIKESDQYETKTTTQSNALGTITSGSGTFKAQSLWRSEQTSGSSITRYVKNRTTNATQSAGGPVNATGSIFESYFMSDPYYGTHGGSTTTPQPGHAVSDILGSGVSLVDNIVTKVVNEGLLFALAASAAAEAMMSVAMSPGDFWDLHFASTTPSALAGADFGFAGWVGENIIVPVVGVDRLTEGGGLLDDLLISGLLATGITSMVDPTPISDILNAGLNAADGNYATAAIRLGTAIIPGGAGRGAKLIGRARGAISAGASIAGRSVAKHAACNAPTALGRAAGRLRGACFVAGTPVVMADEVATQVASTHSVEADPVPADMFGTVLLTGGITGLLAQGCYGRRAKKRRALASVDQVFNNWTAEEEDWASLLVT